MHDTINHLGYIPIRCMNTRRIEQVDDYERTTKSGLYNSIAKLHLTLLLSL